MLDCHVTTYRVTVSYPFYAFKTVYVTVIHYKLIMSLSSSLETHTD